MRGLHSLVHEDTNQFGPGTDLVIGLLALLLVLVAVAGHPVPSEGVTDEGGNFRTASESFSAGDFETNPVTQFSHPDDARRRILRVVQEYRLHANEFPYVFIIGHASSIDVPDAADLSDQARYERNWGFAGRRAATVARELQGDLSSSLRDKIVLVSTGEFDQRDGSNPMSLTNQWVEIVFGREWKKPSRIHAVPSVGH